MISGDKWWSEAENNDDDDDDDDDDDAVIEAWRRRLPWRQPLNAICIYGEEDKKQ